MKRNILILAIVSFFGLNRANAQCSASSSYVCVGESVTYSYSGSGILSWQVPSAGTITSGQGTNTINVIWNTTGTYTVQLDRLGHGSTTLCTIPTTVDNVSGGTLAATNSNLCQGGSTTLTLSGHNGTVVKWQKSVNGGSWTNISSTSTTLSQSNIQYQTKYKAIISKCGNQIDSSIKTINVEVPSGGTITKTSGSSSFCTGQGASGTLKLNNYSLIIDRWEKRERLSNGNWGSWVSLGSHSDTYSYSVTKETNFRVIVDGEYCQNVPSENTYTITENTPTVAGTITSTKSGPVCAGETFTLNIAGQDGTVTWYKKQEEHNWVSLSSPSDVSININTEYKAIVTKSVCGTSATSNVISMQVVAPAVTGSISEDSGGCQGINGTLRLNGQDGTVTKWEKSEYNSLSSSWSSFTPVQIGESTIFDYSDLLKDTRYRVAVANSCGVQVNSSNFVVYAQNINGGTINATSSNVCQGESVTLTLSGNDGAVLKWQKSVNGGAWNDISNTNVVLDQSDMEEITQFQAIVEACGRQTPSTIKTISVSIPDGGEVSLQSGNNSFCTGQSASGTLVLTNYTGLVKRWEMQEQLSNGTWQSNWTPIGHIGMDTYDYSVTVGTRFRAIVDDVPCTDIPSINFYTINELPPTTAGFISATINSVCPTEEFSLSISENNGSVQWFAKDEVHDWYSISPSNISINFDTKFKAVVTNSACGTSVDTDSLTVTIRPNSEVGTLSLSNNTVCYDAPVDLMLTYSIGENINWKSSTDNGQNWSTFSTQLTNSITHSFNEDVLIQSEVTGECGDIIESNIIPLYVSSYFPAPDIDNSTVCIGERTTLSVNNEQGSDIVYMWYDANQDLIAQTVDNSFLTGTITSATQFYVAFNSLGCIGGLEPFSVNTYNEIETPNRPSINIQSESEYSISLDKENSDDAQVTYYWQTFKDGIDESLNDAIINDPTDGFYFVKAKSIDGCWSAPSEGVKVVNHNTRNNNYGLSKVNYVKTYSYLQPSTEVEFGEEPDNETDPYMLTTQITYIDGLGRSIQEVVKMGSKSEHDQIIFREYDEYGKSQREFLPYISTTNGGDFQTNPNIDQREFYANGVDLANSFYPFSYSKAENSSINKIEATYAAGKDWVGSLGTNNERNISITNLSNTAEDEVYQWQMLAGDKWPSLGGTGWYEAGDLYKNVTTDEQGNRVIEFVNKLQQTVLKRVQAVESPDMENYVLGQWADTYYVYDDFGNLRYVLPPEAIQNVSTDYLSK